MKTIVVYKSMLGTTQFYSDALAKRVSGDISRWYMVKERDLEKYDTVVISSGPYEEWKPMVEFLDRFWPVLKDRNVVLLAVGELPPERGPRWKLEEKLPQEVKDHVKSFELPGKLNPDTADQIKEENLDPVVEYIKSLDSK